MHAHNYTNKRNKCRKAALPSLTSFTAPCIHSIICIICAHCGLSCIRSAKFDFKQVNQVLSSSFILNPMVNVYAKDKHNTHTRVHAQLNFDFVWCSFFNHLIFIADILIAIRKLWWSVDLINWKCNQYDAHCTPSMLLLWHLINVCALRRIVYFSHSPLYKSTN